MLTLFDRIRSTFTRKSRRKRFAPPSVPVEILESRSLLTALLNGQEIVDVLAMNDTDTHTFQAQNGETVLVSVGELADADGNFSGASPVLEVLAPDNSRVGIDTGSWSATLSFTASQTGTYRAIVAESNFDDDLAYRIRAVSLPGATASSLIANRDDALHNGEETLSSLPVGGFNLHPFSATNDETVLVSVGELADSDGVFSGASPVLEVFAPDGSSVDFDTGSWSGTLQFWATQSGTFTAVVAESNFDDDLNYRIRAVSLPGASASSLIANRDDALHNGEETLSSLPVGGFNVHPFSATNDETVLVSVGELADADGVLSGASPVLEIFAPDGTSVDFDSGSWSGTLQFTASQSGTYTAVVAESNFDDDLDYRIRALSLPGATAPSLIANRDDSLHNGEETLSSLPVGGFNVHPFSATIDETVLVSVGELADSDGVFSGASPVLEIFAPDGSSVDSDTGSWSGTLQFTASQSGTYTAVIAESNFDDDLDYRIRAVSLPGATASSLIADRDNALHNGEETLSSLPVGGFNVHPFSATIDNTVLVSVGELADADGVFSGASPVLEIFAPDGSSVDFDTGSWSGTLQFTASQSGTYTAVVAESNFDDDLDYRIRAMSLPGTTAPSLIANRDRIVSNGTSADSNVPLGSFSLFPIDLDAGERLTLSLTELADSNGSFGATPVIELITPNGNSAVIQQESGGSNTVIVEQNIGETGTWHILVSESNFDDDFPFQMNVGVGVSTVPFIVDPASEFASTQNPRETIRWTPIVDAVRYRVWYSRPGESAAIIDTLTTTTEFTPATDLKFGRYDIQVLAQLSNGSVSDWSPPLRLNLPTTPSFERRPTFEETTRPTLRWNQSLDAETYELWVNNVTTNQSRVVHVSDLTAKEFTFAENLDPGTYHAWVRGRSGPEVTAWSAAIELRVRPQTDNAAVSTFSRRPEFSWQGTNQPATWHVYVRDANRQVIQNTNVTGNSWSPSSDLPDGRTTWWVRVTIAGQRTWWSTAQTVFIGGRTEIDNPSATTANPVSVEWRPVTGADSYDVFILRESDNQVIRELVGNVTSWNAGQLQIGSYRVWVRAISTSNELGYWSRVVRFTVG